jgi:hypothetical protein
VLPEHPLPHAIAQKLTLSLSAGTFSEGLLKTKDMACEHRIAALARFTVLDCHARAGPTAVRYFADWGATVSRSSRREAERCHRLAARRL